jgi:hypothetical protein
MKNNCIVKATIYENLYKQLIENKEQVYYFRLMLKVLNHKCMHIN